MQLLTSLLQALFVTSLVMFAHGDVVPDDGGDDTEDDASSDSGSSPSSDSAGSGTKDAGGGAGAGGIDMKGLQGALDQGGVAALSNMLKAMSAAAPQNDDERHIKRDKGGQQVYDFRDLSPPVPAAPADPAPQAAAQPISEASADPAPQVLAQPAAHPAPRPLSKQLRQNQHSQHHDHRAVNEAVHKALAHRAHSADVPLVKVPATPQEAPTSTKQPGDEHLIIWPPVEVPETVEERSADESATTPVNADSADKSDDDDRLQFADLTKGLLAVKHGVDALMNEASVMVRSGGVSSGHSDQDLIHRLEALEVSNKQGKSEEAEQAAQISKLEAEQRLERAELNAAKKSLDGDKSLENGDEGQSLQLPQVGRHHHRHRHVRRHHSQQSFVQPPKENLSGIRTFFHLKAKPLVN